jgi:hypothetical protein
MDALAPSRERVSILQSLSLHATQSHLGCPVNNAEVRETEQGQEQCLACRWQWLQRCSFLCDPTTLVTSHSLIPLCSLLGLTFGEQSCTNQFEMFQERLQPSGIHSCFSFLLLWNQLGKLGHLRAAEASERPRWRQQPAELGPWSLQRTCDPSSSAV